MRDRVGNPFCASRGLYPRCRTFSSRLGPRCMRWIDHLPLRAKAFIGFDALIICLVMTGSGAVLGLDVRVLSALGVVGMFASYALALIAARSIEGPVVSATN